jgi:hypothetical protein
MKKYCLEIELPYVPPPVNIQMRMHYHVRSKMNAMHRDMIFLAVIGKKPKAPLERCKITIIRYSDRYIDSDSATGSYKSIIDAFQIRTGKIPCAGIIVDDSYKTTGDWYATQELRAKIKGPMSYIRIEERS